MVRIPAARPSSIAALLAAQPAISHGVEVQGVAFTPQPPNVSWLTPQNTPAILQMNDDDFPKGFLTDLAGRSVIGNSSLTTLTAPLTLFQPVQRMVTVALLQLTCDSYGSPRLDPTRVDSAGLVIRRVPQAGGIDQYELPPSKWMRSAVTGKCGWVKQVGWADTCDPDPTRQIRPTSGQPALDQLLAAQGLVSAQTETYSPAFVAPPDTCNAAKTTLVYGVIPTASSEISTKATVPPQYGPEVSALLTTLLSQVTHNPILPGKPVNYQWMSDDYATAQPSGSNFLTFSATLRLLYSVLGAFEAKPEAQALIGVLNQFNVYVNDSSGASVAVQMGAFYQNAATNLMDYDPFGSAAAQNVTMPNSWDNTDPAAILAAIQALLQARTSNVTAPVGRFQDPTRTYRLRVFLRIKGHAPGCPTQLVWSNYGDPFRIAAWHEPGGRVAAPVPLPDPTDPSFRANAKKPNSYFAVPAALMNLMNQSSLAGLSKGTGTAPSAAGGISLNWICGFNIPLITICAFFVLNLFLIVLNLVFFWLPFIKICIPFPFQPPGTSGDDDGQ